MIKKVNFFLYPSYWKTLGLIEETAFFQKSQTLISRVSVCDNIRRYRMKINGEKQNGNAAHRSFTRRWTNAVLSGFPIRYCKLGTDNSSLFDSYRASGSSLTGLRVC